MAEIAVGMPEKDQPLQNEVSSAKFAQIARSQEFRALRRAKLTFIWPVSLLFIVFYLLLPLLAGYAKPLMSQYVVGFITFGYAYGLIYYLIAWGLAFLYVIVARRFDRAAEKIARNFVGRKDGR
ncbi:MAG: DUF485 domain-containing protein [Candidatus Carbobacillus sp.]|nr:DUF485 domain-containing protein [Candidatus Carbobacillus sp.]